MATNTKQTRTIVGLAATALANNATSDIARSLAASALAQAGTNKQTGEKMEDVASRVLHSNKYNKETKSLAASVLSQSNKKR